MSHAPEVMVNSAPAYGTLVQDSVEAESRRLAFIIYVFK